MPIIRTTQEPWREISVTDGEYLWLLRQGLIYTGEPVTPPPTFNDAQYAELADPNGLAAQRVLTSALALVDESVVASSVAAGALAVVTPQVEALVTDASDLIEGKTNVVEAARVAALGARDESVAARDEAEAWAAATVALQDAAVTELLTGAGPYTTRTAFNGIAVRPRSKITPDSTAAAPLTYINAEDYGAVPGNTGDQTAAINAALVAAGPGSAVRLNGGQYRCTGTIVVPAWTTLEAGSGIFGAGGSAAVELVFAISGSAVAMTLGTYASLRHVKLRGPGTAVGTCKGITSASATIEGVSVINFVTGVHLTNAYYFTAIRCEWSRNGNALQLTDCYNVNLHTPLMYCASTVDSSPGNAIVGAARSLNIFGGSIEGYKLICSMASAQAVAFFGTYFETTVDANAFGIVASALDKVSITLLACMVYLNGHNRWVDTAGSTNATLVAHGNHFVAVTGSVQAPIAYNIGHDQANVIGPDNWGEVVKAGSVYCSVASGALPARGSMVTMPIGWTNGPNVYDGRRKLDGFNLQALNANGAVTIDSRYQKHVISLAANATSSTIANASNIAQELEISWMQDATGGRTYAWPASCRFAGGVAPSDTTANTQTTARFRYNTSTGHWVEVSRAVAVPN